MMDLDELRGVQASERSTDSLQSLRDSFYREVAEYINGLHEERARAAERADDPFGSEEVRHLTDEIETAQEVAEAIYDRRLGKVVKRASLAAAGMSTDEEGLTDEETALFEAAVEEIESRRSAVLSEFAGESDTLAVDAGGDGGDEAQRRVDPDPVARETAADADASEAGASFDASDAMGDQPTDAADAPADESDTDRSGNSVEERRVDDEGPTTDGGQLAVERATVRITRDVGEIMGVDEHVYDLADGDVVTLPNANVEPLLDRDAASRIE